LIIVLAAGLVVRRKIITESQIKALSAVTINIFLPCMIFNNILRNFAIDRISIWPVLPLGVAAIVMIGFAAGTIVFARDRKEKKDLIALSAIQNGYYLILPIASIVFADNFDEFKLYCFLMLPGYSPLMWGIGKFLMCAKPDEKINLREFISPPLIAVISATVIVLVRGKTFGNSMILDSAEMIGSAAIPLGIFILGAMLGGIRFNLKPYILDAIKVISVKLMIVPACVIAILYFTGLARDWPLMASFFLLQAASAPATSLLIIVKHYGGNEQRAEAIALITYICCIITIPFWLATWNMLI
jgi:hypothetical protein